MILGKYQCGYWKTGQMIYLLQKRAIGNTASQYRIVCNKGGKHREYERPSKVTEQKQL